MIIHKATEARRSLVSQLLRMRRPAGYWEGTLSSDTQATAAAAIALHMGGNEDSAEKALAYLSLCMNADGGCGFTRSIASDIDPSIAALVAFHLCDTKRQYDQIVESLQSYCTSQSSKTKTLLSKLLLHLGRLESDIALPSVDPSKLPYPERTTLGLISAYNAHNSDQILAYSRHFNGQRSWRGLVTITGIASACLGRIGAQDEDSLRWLLRYQNVDGGFPHTHSLGVWDTVLASLALLDAGEDPKSASWLLSAQDASGGWFWDIDGRSIVDFDDTGYALWVLLRSGIPLSNNRIQKAMALLRDVQNPDGGFPSFEKSGLVIERPSWNMSIPDVTAHVLQALKAAGMSHEAARAESWLVANQIDGVWKGFWFTGDLYSSVSVLEAVDKNRVDLKRLRKQVLACRNSDGGFGSPERSTIEETAWGIGTLIEAGSVDAKLLDESVEWIADRCQGPAASVGTFFSHDKRYSDTVFPLAYSLSALNKYLRLKKAS